ncbi:dna binding protein [Nannochloropsis oceanica]
MEGQEEECGSEKEGSTDNLIINMSRIRAIAKQDPDVGGLSKGAVATISAATRCLMEKLLLGAANEARVKAQSKSRRSCGSGRTKPMSVEGVLTVTPDDIQAFILKNDELQFLRDRVKETQESGYLESYRARVREGNKASSKTKLKALVGGALGGEGRHENEECKDEDEDDTVESAAAALVATVDGGGGRAGGGSGAGEAAAAAPEKAESMVLDENYGGEDY